MYEGKRANGSEDDPEHSPGNIPTTRWSLVVRTADEDDAVSNQALGELLQLYWKPLYVFARSSGLSAEDAEDGVQGFCESVIRRNSLRNAAPEAGRFRSFLLGGMKNHLREGFRAGIRQKRGGRATAISMDAAEASLEMGTMEKETPDKAFDRRWAFTLLEHVIRQLKTEYEARGRGELFTLLEPALAWNGSEVSYTDLGAQLSMNVAAVQQAVKRMRQRYRKLLEAAIGDTVDGPEALEEERNYLIRILSES